MFDSQRACLTNTVPTIITADAQTKPEYNGAYLLTSENCQYGEKVKELWVYNSEMEIQLF